MRVLDLFSGIGGFSLGLERAGMRTVAFCERDEYCRAVLRKHWPDVPCFDDIHAIDADGLDRIGPVDLVCGGFPCQPFSVAGKQKAHADDRHLWPAMREVIALARPAWVVGENVAGIIPLALDDVLSDLEGLGYAARAFVIPACAVDAPHRRDRVWIVARDADGEGKSTRALDAGKVAELCGASADAERDELRVESGRRGWTSGAGQAEPRDDGASQPMAVSSSDGRLPRRASDAAQEPGGGNLIEAVSARLWPTPNANDVRDRGHLGMPAIQRRVQKGKQLNLGMVVSDVSGALNPTWVEWLMGFPPGWTALDASGMPSSRRSSKRSAAQS